MTAEDLPEVGKLAGKLVRQHFAFDPKRFLQVQNPEAGYARYFAGELEDEEVVLVVAEDDAHVVGYAYARLEPKNWNDLLDACGKLHDVYVDEGARGRGAGEALLREVFERLGKMGAPRIVLLTASQNGAAQRLFAKLGFRTTMLEMTREL
jgi:ribosomal protein S18 acetylase RimI-like enzyme